ncbi:MAG TPA: phosphatase PAP2 family protein [Longimicrobiales bacterium]|nr:phosphatase PAP2 family protein [Longimicrobiales bacterium]
MHRFLRSGVLIGTVVSAPAAGQDRSVGGDLKDLWGDARFIVGAPTHPSSGDMRTVAALGGIAGGLLLLDEPLHQWISSDPVAAKILRPFDESGPIAIMGRTWFFLLPLSAGLYGAGHAFDSHDLRNAGLGCATANLTTTVTRTLVALLIGRDRPGVESGPFQFELLAFGDWDRRSFPGGHASNIMSCASFFAHRFDLGIAEPAVWALAGGVGVARILDDAHWASDTFVGMAYGYSVGRNIAHRSMDREATRSTERSLQPGLTLRWTITF